MARVALIDGDGVVVNVIVADPAWAVEHAASRGLTAREIVTERETPKTAEAIVSRACEPGAVLVERDAATPEEIARSHRSNGRDVVDDFERGGSR